MVVVELDEDGAVPGRGVVDEDEGVVELLFDDLGGASDILGVVMASCCCTTAGCPIVDGAILILGGGGNPPKFGTFLVGVD